MLSINDIQFNRYFFEPAVNWALVLCEQIEIPVNISLPDAGKMSFIRPFDSTNACQNHINTNPQKIIRLFAYDENLIFWTMDNNAIPNNLPEITIFCQADDRVWIRSWSRRFTQRYPNIHLAIVTCEELNHRLLTFGLEHLERLYEEFRDDFGILNLLDADYKGINESLQGDAAQRANEENESIRLSEEARS